MKRVCIVFLCLTLVFVLAACKPTGGNAGADHVPIMTDPTTEPVPSTMHTDPTVPYATVSPEQGTVPSSPADVIPVPENPNPPVNNQDK